MLRPIDGWTPCTALAEARVPGFSTDLLASLDDPVLRPDAIRALAAFNDPGTVRALLDRYAKLSPSERDDAVHTLAARPEWALDLLRAIEKGTIPRSAISPSLARQLQGFHRQPIDEALARVWGSVRPSSAAKTAAIARYKAMLTPQALKNANPSNGRAVFEKTCLQCHKLYQAGGDIGPDLTGSNRDNLDYVLGNVVDPSAVVAHDYMLTTVATKDGRVVSGIVRERNDAAIVIRTVNDRVVIPLGEVEGEVTAQTSMMPEGLLNAMSSDDVRDLIAYLAGREQVPLPPASPTTDATTPRSRP